MDSFPEDLLAGVFPLVFAVDAIQGNDGGSPRRSLFDRFLDAVAASLVEEAPEKKSTSLSLFRSELEDELGHDALEEFSFGQQSQTRSKSITSGIYPGFHPGFGMNKALNRTLSSESVDSNKVTSFAKTLNSGRDFFQQARIEPISARHGFPPSKDPEGTKNLSSYLHQVVKRKNLDSLSKVFHSTRIEGILPAGWLEKHVHALPSVILVVCNVTSDRISQEKQDQNLYETIDHLRQNLVPKRNCIIHVIGLLQDDVTPTQGDIWGRSVSSEFGVNHGLQPSTELLINVTLLRASSDLQANDTGMPTSPALKRLHRTIRDSSLSYYIHQTRRAKNKLSMMLGLKDGVEYASPPPQLLPFCIRYCFKIAIFYEFQAKAEKSLLYMSEGYRYASKYYQFLVAKDSKASINTSDSDDYQLESAAHIGDGNDVEVSLVGTGAISWESVIPEAPKDMIHQSKVLAEWMHMKVLAAAFSSRTDSGLFAASEQWRAHSRIFCSSMYQDNGRIPRWNHWMYVARQRIVFTQLMERHPPSVTSDDGDRALSEALQQCSLWRAYTSAAEAMLRLSLEVEKSFVASEGACFAETEAEKSDTMRPQYVGAIDSKGLFPFLVDERRVPHKDKALEFILRAITLYETELEREKRGFYAEDSFRESSSSREGARMHYLAGGILLGMGRHEQATSSLGKAAKYASGWQQLELAIRRMLIECYEKYIPATSDSESDALGSMILDSYFNAEMSPQELRKALGHFLSISGGESLKWFHKTVDDDDTSLPFSFAVSFPWKTHAMCGDTVQASVLIRSNLDYAVHVNSVVLLSLAGELSIHSDDLRSATNVSEGSEEGIIIQAKTAITISTEVVLPKDTSFIASDESGNGGEQVGVAGKGSFAKNARPRSAGVTAAGGARFLAEDTLPDTTQQSQGWNLRFLGGKPLCCDGLRIAFYPVQAEKSGTEKDSLTFIELTMLREKPRTAANIKRTPYEEENYIASAWSRPAYLPLSRGPRSLRVSEPIPHLSVTNITDEMTFGKAVEGTINRIVLKLQAGSEEVCSNIKVSVSCFSVLVTPSGSTKRLVNQEDITAETENSLDMTNPAYRTPALLGRTKETSVLSLLGYCTPRGWAMLGSGQTQETINFSTLNGGECSYISFNLFRPASDIEVDLEPTESILLEKLADWSVCKTDYYVTVSYQQERPSTKRTRPATRGQRRSRRPPTMTVQPYSPDITSQSTKVEQIDGGEQDASDEVTLEFIGSVVWTNPLTATFSRGSGNSCPSGSRHPSNSLARDPLYAAKEFVLVDGESTTAVCHLKLDSAMEGLGTDIVSVSFKPGNELEEQTDLILKSKAVDGRDGLLYKTTPDDQSRLLSTTDAEFSISYVVEAQMRPNVLRGCLSSHLGVIEVEWLPKAIPLSPDITKDPSAVAAGIDAHGPLALDAPSIVRFRGPPFYIESAPFIAEMVQCSEVPYATKPFEIAYKILNNTALHQHLTIKLHALPIVDGGKASDDDGILLAGTVQGDLTLNPHEMRTLSYTLLALRPGLIQLPAFEILSTRYNTYVVQEHGKSKEIFVMP
ncbi:hypothetical protein FisN_1Lh584 [Fistulifera solaris]|uniref:Trafficking protein particle complex subunit 11 domain-containing protein n=1 Tax=Fistulifera solaris TaxID=1519565 RepID=A0A1Z5K0Y1_FISSO|nr:hypothetical protein FisN_1Lh584 [Fistulifera solaris]|eukprot:GAX19945.1 hypothetical protein FisN_1Lh584 [Fistulifera solaris]